MRLLAAALFALGVVVIFWPTHPHNHDPDSTEPDLHSTGLVSRADELFRIEAARIYRKYAEDGVQPTAVTQQAMGQELMQVRMQTHSRIDELRNAAWFSSTLDPSAPGYSADAFLKFADQYEKDALQ